MSNISAQLIQDSEYRVFGKVARITTFILEYPRFIHSEFMTHRCLVGETELVFDLPSGKGSSDFRKFTMSMEDFHNKWNEGAAEHAASRFIEHDLSLVVPEQIYSAKQLATIFGFTVSNLRSHCRNGRLLTQNPDKGRTEDHMILGQDFIDYRLNSGTRTFSIRDRLANMKIRMLNEDTNQIEHTRVTDIWMVGEKETFKVSAGDYHITGTADHPVLTPNGWREIGELMEGDYLISAGFGVDSPVGSIRHKKINGQWVSRWNQQVLPEVSTRQGDLCANCGSHDPLEIHHLEPVHARPELAFDIDNVVATCNYCHKHHYHKTQGWQVSNKLIGKPVRITSIEPNGIKPVFDLSVESPFHNFVANDLVVHNCFSRNAASSRAIPVHTLIDQTRLNPVYPVYWGKEQSGMVAATELSHDEQLQAKKVWRQAANDARKAARRLTKLLVHKQIANRVLECFQHIKVMVTATDFANFFALRAHPDAQPEIKVLAEKMLEQYQASEPMRLKRGEWHLPFIERKRGASGKLLYFVEGDMVSLERAKKISASAAAQTSYRKEDLGVTKALNIFDRLASATPVHASPFEHQATPMLLPFLRSRNFRGWRQFRTEIPNETVYKLPKAA